MWHPFRVCFLTFKITTGARSCWGLWSGGWEAPVSPCTIFNSQSRSLIWVPLPPPPTLSCFASYVGMKAKTKAGPSVQEEKWRASRICWASLYTSCICGDWCIQESFILPSWVHPEAWRCCGARDILSMTQTHAINVNQASVSLSHKHHSFSNLINSIKFITP